MADTPPPPAADDFFPLQLKSKPGVKRDGTDYEGDAYTDARWCRFQRNLPRKIGGYRQITKGLQGTSRGLYMNSRNGFSYAASGSAVGIEGFTIDPNGVISLLTNRTPGGFATNTDYLWQMDSMYNAAGGSQQSTLIAHPGHNLNLIDSAATSQVLIGNMFDFSALVAISGSDCSGGICVIHPYLFYFGSDGFIGWSDINQPTILASGAAGTARVCGTKIVRGMSIRSGQGSSPGGIFWALDALVRASFIGGSAVFQFDGISDNYSSILSSASPVEFDGMYFWPGIDRFQMYNGVIQEVPNDMNINYFFDNLNYAYRQKVFGFKVPRWGEIWWCAPMFGATEPNHAIILNVREKSWYDTPLPDSMRTAAFMEQMQRYPIMAEASSPSIWQHEFGYDEIPTQGGLKAIDSYFVTSLNSQASNSQQPTNAAYHVDRVELDLVQAGEMSISLMGQVNARGKQITPVVQTFQPGTEFAMFKAERRLLQFKVESNAQGGNYEWGETLVHVKNGSRRLT